jgi:hypothetical protein
MTVHDVFFLKKDEAFQYDWHACLKNGLARRLRVV